MTAIRDFESRDAALANALTNHFIVHTAIHLGVEPATDAEFAALWTAGRERFPWLAAEVDGRFAGYAKAGPWRLREGYAKTVETGIYIAAEARGRGVGKALYAGLLARLRTAGFHRAVAAVTLPNEASVRLHEAVGFCPVGVFREAGWKFGAWRDVGFWEARLG